MSKSSHVRSYQDPVRLSEDQVKIEDRICQVSYKSKQVRSGQMLGQILSSHIRPSRVKVKQRTVTSGKKLFR